MVVMASQLWWPLLSSWISPGAAWFVFFNAVVAAIAVVSSCTQQEQEPASSRRRLCRSASSVVLDQLRSFSLFSVHPTTAGDVLPGVSDSDYHLWSPEAEVVPPPQVPQVSMVVTTAETPPPMAPVTGESVAPSAPVATASAADESASAPASNDGDADADEEEQDKSISMDEAYAMIQQLRRPPQPQLLETTTVVSWPQKTKDLAAKGPRRRRRREAEEAAPEGKAELNARADLFIRQFREELKLQRLNSLLRHTHAFGTLDGAPAAVR